MGEHWADIRVSWPTLQDVRVLVPSEREVPLILSIAPAPITGTVGTQPVQITGVGFEPRPSPIVVFENLTAGEEHRLRPHTISPTALLCMLDTDVFDSTWTAKVVNANGTVSYRFPFTVIAPP